MQRGGKFGQTGFVIACTKYQLHNRRKRRAFLHSQSSVAKQFGIIGGVSGSNNREIMRPANRLIKRVARPHVGIARAVGALPCGIQPVGKRGIFVWLRFVEDKGFAEFKFIGFLCLIQMPGNRAVGPNRYMLLTRRRRGKRLFNLKLKRLADFGGRGFFPVDDAIYEINGVVVRRIRQQNSAIHDVDTAIVDEFCLEPNRRAVSDDLQIVIGNARQQRPAWHLIEIGYIFVQPAFGAQLFAEILD